MKYEFLIALIFLLLPKEIKVLAMEDDKEGEMSDVFSMRKRYQKYLYSLYDDYYSPMMNWDDRMFSMFPFPSISNSAFPSNIMQLPFQQAFPQSFGESYQQPGQQQGQEMTPCQINALKKFYEENQMILPFNQEISKNQEGQSLKKPKRIKGKGRTEISGLDSYVYYVDLATEKIVNPPKILGELYNNNQNDQQNANIPPAITPAGINPQNLVVNPIVNAAAANAANNLQNDPIPPPLQSPSPDAAGIVPPLIDNNAIQQPNSPILPKKIEITAAMEIEEIYKKMNEIYGNNPEELGNKLAEAIEEWKRKKNPQLDNILPKKIEITAEMKYGEIYEKVHKVYGNTEEFDIKLAEAIRDWNIKKDPKLAMFL